MFRPYGVLGFWGTILVTKFNLWNNSELILRRILRNYVATEVLSGIVLTEIIQGSYPLLPFRK